MTDPLTRADVTIVPFADEHLDGASTLLAARHRAQRLVEPGLDPAYEDPAAARSEIDALWRTEGASGAAAVAGDETVGFLLGLPRDASWGPNVWVEPAGHAAAYAELVRDLYAAAAARWVEEGLTSHYALVPATDPALVDAWFRLGFGHQHVHAIREVGLSEMPPSAPGLVLRRARRGTSTRSRVSTSRFPNTRRSRPCSRGCPSRISTRRGRSTRPTSTTRASRRSSSSETAR